jgi:hypothetical protein
MFADSLLAVGSDLKGTRSTGINILLIEYNSSEESHLSTHQR